MKTHRYPKMFREAMKEVIDSKLSDILKVLQDSIRIDDDRGHLDKLSDNLLLGAQIARVTAVESELNSYD